MTQPNSHTTPQEDLRAILTAPMRSQISTADFAVSPMSSTGLGEKIHDILAWHEAEATRQKLELLNSIGEPTLHDVGLMQPDQYEGGIIINKWWKERIEILKRQALNNKEQANE